MSKCDGQFRQEAGRVKVPSALHLVKREIIVIGSPRSRSSW